MALTLSPTSIRPAPGESDLVAATRAGDDRAFGELYARYRERIFTFILSRVHDHGRAEDIAQDVFISALRRMRAGDQEIAFKPWIYEIAKNACIDEYRRGHRSREVPLEADPEQSGDSPAAPSLLPTPAAAVEGKQRLNDLCGAFGGLSETHHQLLVLREFEGLSYEEIGDRLDMTRQMVESGLFRARRKLTEEYQELASGRRCQQVQSAIDGGSLASARALGLRDRRRFARHLSHCQGCRHVALAAGVDEALVRPRRIAAKIAALLPFPLTRLRWPWGRGRGTGPGAGGSHQLTGAALQNAPALAEQASGSAVALGPAAAAVAALAIAGVGGGLIHNALASGHARRPAAVVPAAATGHARVHHVVTTGPSSSATAALPKFHAVRGTAASRAVVRGRSTAPPKSRAAGHATSSAGSPGSRSGLPATGVTGRATALAGGAAAAAASPVKQAVSGVGSTAQGLGSTAQGLGSTTRHVVSGVGGAVGKATGGVGNAVSNTVQGAGSTLQQTTSSVTSPVSASSPGQGSGATSSASGAVSSATQTVNQVTTTVTQAVGPVVPGLPH